MLSAKILLSNKWRSEAFKLMINIQFENTKFPEAKKDDGRCVGIVDYPGFSVAMSVYEKDNPEWFDVALNSVINQTVKPSEIVLVVDGPIPDGIQIVIDKYIEICNRESIQLKVISLPENKGLGNALRIAVLECQNELIARMDSDDIAIEDRFEKQIQLFIQDEALDICGGQIEEFIGNTQNIVGKRIVPETDKELKKYIKRRCPFNHVTVLFRKSAICKVGNYQDWFWNEDYYLWIRMALANQKFANLSQTLVYVRVGKDMYNRRGGLKYFKSEIKLQKLLLDKKMIGVPTYIMNCAKRVVVQIMLPNCIRGWVFRIFARS